MVNNILLISNKIEPGYSAQPTILGVHALIWTVLISLFVAITSQKWILVIIKKFIAKNKYFLEKIRSISNNRKEADRKIQKVGEDISKVERITQQFLNRTRCPEAESELKMIKHRCLEARRLYEDIREDMINRNSGLLGFLRGISRHRSDVISEWSSLTEIENGLKEDIRVLAKHFANPR